MGYFCGVCYIKSRISTLIGKSLKRVLLINVLLQADYLSVEHTSGLRLHDEFILVGHEDGRKVNFTVSSLKTPDEYDDHVIQEHEIASNVYVAQTQFSSPFAFSTNSWVRDNDCDKDIRKFKHPQKHYKNDGQNVSVVIQNVDSPFIYYLKSMDNPPYIRFMVPGKSFWLAVLAFKYDKTTQYC